VQLNHQVLVAGAGGGGFGRVDCEYRIGKFEVTTAQWVEFMSAAFDRPRSEWIPGVEAPGIWGGVQVAPNTPGGARFGFSPAAAMRGVGDITWRTAAVYCNWLHNGKSLNRGAFLSGAYDVSSFVTIPGSIYTDQRVRSPAARYFIPTWNEWLKAVHYDPDKDGAGQGGWWTQPNGSDAPLAYGPPGVHVLAGGVDVIPGPDPNGPLAQANSGWGNRTFPGLNPYAVRLGAYPDVQTPWGLLDAAGGTIGVAGGCLGNRDGRI